MGKLSTFRSDPKRELEGVWVDFEDPEDPEVDGKPIRFLVASANNPRYQECMARLLKPHTRRLQRGQDVPPEQMRQLRAKAMSQYMLLDWQNVFDEEDNPIEYTPEQGFEYLRAPEYHTIHSFVLGVAHDESEYRHEADEADKGN